MQTQSSDGNSVCPSVCRTRGLWKNGRKICPDFYTIQKIIQPSFLRRRMVSGGRPLVPEILGQPADSTQNFRSTDPRWSKIADFAPIFARSASAVTSSKKSSINTNRKSTTCFPTSLWWSSYIAPKPPKKAQKRKTAADMPSCRQLWFCGYIMLVPVRELAGPGSLYPPCLAKGLQSATDDSGDAISESHSSH